MACVPGKLRFPTTVILSIFFTSACNPVSSPVNVPQKGGAATAESRANTAISCSITTSVNSVGYNGLLPPSVGVSVTAHGEGVSVAIEGVPLSAYADQGVTYAIGTVYPTSTSAYTAVISNGFKTASCSTQVEVVVSDEFACVINPGSAVVATQAQANHDIVAAEVLLIFPDASGSVTISGSVDPTKFLDTTFFFDETNLKISGLDFDFDSTSGAELQVNLVDQDGNRALCNFVVP